MAYLILFFMGTFHNIGNQWISVSVTDAACSARAGSIVHFYDNYSGTEISSGGIFSGINTGGFIPANGEVTVESDTSLVFHTTHFTSGSGTMPIDLTVRYVVVDRGLEMSYRFEYLNDIEFTSPLDIDFCISDWDSLTISNQTTVDESFALSGLNGYQRFSGDQLFRAHGSTVDGLFVLPNTAKGLAVVLDEPNARYISIRVLDTESPRENATGPDLHSIIPAGQVDEYFVRFSMDEYFAPVFIGGHPQGAERTGAWIMDELPLVHPYHGYIWSFSETAAGDEEISAKLISLLDDHDGLKMNWIILPDGILDGNRDSVWYESGYQDSWSHWHCTWRISTEATPEYLQWLLSIQNNVYPWADRVRMGSHGYHHTPNPDSSYGGYHEFITYEPVEHQERFRMNFMDLNDCGLDTNMVDVIRFSGHRTSLSGLQAIIDHGFTFYCNGWRLIDWYAGERFLNQWITRYQTANGRIWGSNTVWWADFGSPQCPYEYLAEVLEKGKFSLLGCHPVSMFATLSGQAIKDSAYARVDSVITSMENDYENFIWLFPSEYGDYLESCFNVRVNSILGSGSTLSMSLTGAIPEGMTFCAQLNPLDTVYGVYLDGDAIPWELRSNGRLFAVSVDRPFAEHIVTVDLSPMGSAEEHYESGFGLQAVNPGHSGRLALELPGYPEGIPAAVSVFDVTGRVVYSSPVEPQNESLVLNRQFEAGLYLIRMESEGRFDCTQAVVLN